MPHSFEVVTFCLAKGDPQKGLAIVGLWDKDQEALSLHVSGGADCLLHDFRLLRSSRGHVPLLLVADRPELNSYVDNAPVSFKFYALKENSNANPDGPAC